jgi:hypothetical protein
MNMCHNLHCQSGVEALYMNCSKICFNSCHMIIEIVGVDWRKPLNVFGA